MSTFTHPAPDGAARASVVNRTRRVVRQQALAMREQKSLRRSLWLPIAICSPLLLLVGYAMYETLTSYEQTSNGLSEASAQLLLLLVWVLPVTAFLAGLLWYRRGRNRSQGSRP